MDEKEKNIPEETAQIDTVSGDNGGNNQNKGAQAPARARGKMSARTKKRVIAVAIVTGALLLTLATVLIVMTVLNNRPPKLEDVRERFEKLLTDSQEVNEIIWGAGLPTYKRVERVIKSYEVDVVKENGDPVLDKDGNPVKKTLGYYLFEDEALGTIVSYEYQTRVSEGKKNEDGITIYTVYDVEHGCVLTEYKNGAARFARKTQTPVSGETALFEKDGYYYYALSDYKNEDLAYAGVYTGEEDSHYEYVRFDQTYKYTDDIKAALDAVYSNAFVAPLYEYLFTGVIGAINEANQPAYMDYTDDEDATYLMRSNDTGSWKWRDPLPAVSFDFSTMQMVKGNAKKVTVTLDYRLAGSDVVKQMTVDFVLESGMWLLNTPTFG